MQRNSNIAQVPPQSSTFDNNDRLNSDVYDANGNTKQSNGKSFNYDFENKLTSTSDGITIVYDGDGNRVSKTVNGVTTNYLVDTNNLTGYAQVVEEIVSGQVAKKYTYGHDLISQNHNGAVSFFNYDGHGSVRQLSDLTGSITDTYTYDAFGNLISQTGSTDNNYLYAGEQFDADLGFYYNRARYLNVNTGRFISQDSFEGLSSTPMSLHKYTYANPNAVNYTDPSGYFSLADVAITVMISMQLVAISSMTFNSFRRDDILEIDSEVIIIADTGWSEVEAVNATTSASSFWIFQAGIHPIVKKIRSVNSPKRRFLATPLLSGTPKQRSDKADKYYGDLLDELSSSEKHVTIFTGDTGLFIEGYARVLKSGKHINTGLSVISGGIHLNSITVAHEWGHTFGLDDTIFGQFRFNLHSSFLTIPALSIDQRSEAREFVKGNYPYRTRTR